jgi:hypothetical protein
MVVVVMVAAAITSQFHLQIFSFPAGEQQQQQQQQQHETSGACRVVSTEQVSANSTRPCGSACVGQWCWYSVQLCLHQAVQRLATMLAATQMHAFEGTLAAAVVQGSHHCDSAHDRAAPTMVGKG